MKINTASNLINKVLYISDKKFQSENINKIRNILIKNNYPTYIINQTTNLANEENENKTDKQQDNRIFCCPPFIPKLTEPKILKTIINSENTTIAYKSNETLRGIFARKTTTTDKLKQENVVYEVTCKGNNTEKCNKVYVGTTKRMLSVRLSEHEADINRGKERTALAQHIKESGHTVCI